MTCYSERSSEARNDIPRQLVIAYRRTRTKSYRKDEEEAKEQEQEKKILTWKTRRERKGKE